MKCETCHGEKAMDRKFKMPNPDLPKLPTTPEGFKALSEKKPEATKFMGTQVKPKMAEMLHQVMVTVRETGRLVPMGPMTAEVVCRDWAADVNKQIAEGQRRDWTKAEVFPMTPISQGAH